MYTHSQISRPIDFARIMKVVFVSIVLLAFATVARADLSEMGHLDKALTHCESVGGTYSYEENTCKVVYYYDDQSNPQMD